MFERTSSRLHLGVYLEANWAELHLGDRVTAVATLGRRRESDDVSCPHLAEHALGRQKPPRDGEFVVCGF